MIKIDMDHWDRREHFNLFFSHDLPFYNVNFNVDITGLKTWAKGLGVALNNALIYLVTESLERIDNFRYRMVDGDVVLVDRLVPSFACIRGNEELFRFITVELEDNLVRFDRTVKQAIEESDSYFNMGKLQGRCDFVFISALPWIPFTGIDHTLSLDKTDGIPRVSWGKCFEDRGKTFVPFNIRVNHIFVDGLHVGRFFETLNERIKQEMSKENE